MNPSLNPATAVLLFSIGTSLVGPATADTTPSPFSFEPMYNVRRLFPAVTHMQVYGIDAPTPITIVNGEYATPHTGFTSAPGLVVNRDVVYVRQAVPATFDTPTTTTLTVGGVSAQFTTRTIARRVLTSGQLRDFNGDGYPDMIWRNEVTGDTAVWLLDDVFPATGTFLEGRMLLIGRLDWAPTHFGDFDGDGTTDIVWRNSTSGETALWLMGNGALRQGTIVMSDPAWTVTHVADFDGDGTSDLIWRNATFGETAVWLMNGLQFYAGATLVADPNWHVALTCDLNGDRRADIVWHSATLGNAAWLVNGTALTAGAMLAAGSDYEPVLAPDLDNDGKDDLVWYKPSTSETFGWLMDGLVPTAGGNLNNIWREIPIAMGNIDEDGKTDLYYRSPLSGWVNWVAYDGLRAAHGGSSLSPTQLSRGFADFDGNGLVDDAYFETAGSPPATWLVYRLPASLNYPSLKPPLLLLASPDWKLL